MKNGQRTRGRVTKRARDAAKAAVQIAEMMRKWRRGFADRSYFLSFPEIADLLDQYEIGRKAR